MEYAVAAVAAVLLFALGQWSTRTLVARQDQTGIFYRRGRIGAPDAVFNTLSVPWLSWRWRTVFLPTTIPYKGGTWILKMQWIVIGGGAIMRHYDACEAIHTCVKKVRTRRSLEKDEVTRFEQWYEPLH